MEEWLRSDDRHRDSGDGGETIHPRHIRIHARVFGRVQGVGFRYSAVRVAKRVQVTGWVRNERDGSVTVEAQGSDQAIGALERWLGEGPSWAHVDNIEIERIRPRKERDFVVR
ncbi:MAG: acylphosphatase [Bifidobacterium sp.]|uniref:Acylphosphatase n=1 Tax=Bifidobacterium fermentum TaxID=3059035 RepID=A0AB39UCP1_9BIFI